jgi:multidrug efflux pump subunit AcrA (membrane-fusion protein)
MTDETPSSPIFRRIAMDQLSSPEQLDQLMEVTRLRSWLALVGLGILLLTAIVWSIFGTVSATIPAEGMLIRPDGLLDAYAPTPGAITAVTVSEGAVVTKGQVVAHIDQPDLAASIAQLESDLQGRRQRFAGSADLAGGHRPGTAPRTTTRDAEQNGIDEAERSLRDMRDRLAASSTIKSPYAGKVLEIKVRVGDLVERGSRILSLQLADADAKGLQAVIYVSAQEGKNVTPGMRVEISPSTAAPEEYGYLLGTITYVSEFPATRDGMMRVLANDALVSSLSTSGPPFTAYASLQTAGGAGGYRWTSRKGNDLRVNSGTPCEVYIRVRDQRPIELVLPFVRQLLGA